MKPWIAFAAVLHSVLALSCTTGGAAPPSRPATEAVPVPALHASRIGALVDAHRDYLAQNRNPHGPHLLYACN